MATQKQWPISSEAAKVFWLNLIVFAVWCAAEVVVRTTAKSDHTMLFTVSSIIFQLLLMGASFMTAFLWTELSETKKVLFSEIADSGERVSKTLSDTSKNVLTEVRQAMRKAEEIRDELSHGFFNFEGRSYRTLTYFPKTGAVYYGRDEEANRNILLNNLTLREILSEVQKAKTKSHNGMSLLRRLGFVAGNRFAARLRDMLEKEDTDPCLESWLKKWVKYDSEAGFGLLSLDSFSTDPCEVRIAVINSFLTHGNHSHEQPSLCGFMEGYIEGLLKHLPKELYENCGIDEESIRVSEPDCYHAHRTGKRGCVFLAQMQPSLAAGCQTI